MTARQIKWRMYWALIKLTKRWPRRPERVIVNSVAGLMVDLFKEPMTYGGLPVVFDERLAPGEWYVVDGHRIPDDVRARVEKVGVDKPPDWYAGR